MAMNVGSDSGEDEVVSAINTTPLVDVMLVLLIIFLITIPVVTQTVPMSLPKETNIANCNEILAHVQKGVLSLEFCRTYLTKFLSDGTLSKADLLNFYSGGDRREKYRAIQHTIDAMTKGKENE